MTGVGEPAVILRMESARSEDGPGDGLCPSTWNPTTWTAGWLAPLSLRRLLSIRLCRVTACVLLRVYLGDLEPVQLHGVHTAIA